MNIQIFGTRKDRNTQKAERWFRERGISYQLRLLEEKGISPRELDSVLQQLGTDGVLDTESKAYRDRGLAWMEFDAREEILANPLLMKLPVVRNGARASAGMSESIWEQWRREES